MAPILAPHIKLNNDYEMPALGLGTYKVQGRQAEETVKHAIDVGYRHFDTAFLYQNEAEVGRAICSKITQGVVKREDVFVTTKLWNTFHEPARVEEICRKQLAALGLGYIDLYLLHFPVAYKYVNEHTMTPTNAKGEIEMTNLDYLETYKAMEQLVKLGLVRSLGLSNFNIQQVGRVVDNCEIKPVVNQVECSPALNQKHLIKVCRTYGIAVTAYTPLGRPKPLMCKPDFLYGEKTRAIAMAYNKTPTQIVLRYLIEIGVVPLPMSTNPEHIAENFNIFNFKLAPEDVAVMDSYNANTRVVTYKKVMEQGHKYYPFLLN